MDGGGRTLTNSNAGKPALWRLAELHQGDDGAITLVLDGESRENGRPVLARTALTRNGTRIRITELTRRTGEPFLMRHSYDRRMAGEASGASR